MRGSLVVVDDVAESFSKIVTEQILKSAGKTFSLAFSGGATARACYERFAAHAGSILDWSRLTAWWGDERCVPLDDPDSNYRLVEESLLSRVDKFQAIHPMRSDLPDSAEAYEQMIRSSAPIDLIHLGLGPDGHTASLFPGSGALAAPSDRLVVENVDPLGNNPHRRLTFTYPGIARCRTVLVTVEGEAKRNALRRVLDHDPSAPASHIDDENVIWLVDHSAMAS